MWMARIGGWTDVIAFSESKDKARDLAVQAKKARCRDDLDKWNWQTVSDYYGATLHYICDGLLIIEGDETNENR